MGRIEKTLPYYIDSVHHPFLGSGLNISSKSSLGSKFKILCVFNLVWSHKPFLKYHSGPFNIFFYSPFSWPFPKNLGLLNSLHNGPNLFSNLSLVHLWARWDLFSTKVWGPPPWVKIPLAWTVGLLCCLTRSPKKFLNQDFITGKNFLLRNLFRNLLLMRPISRKINLLILMGLSLAFPMSPLLMIFMDLTWKTI